MRNFVFRKCRNERTLLYTHKQQAQEDEQARDEEQKKTNDFYFIFSAFCSSLEREMEIFLGVCCVCAAGNRLYKLFSSARAHVDSVYFIVFVL